MNAYSNFKEKLNYSEAYAKGVFSLPTYPDLDKKKLTLFTKLLKSIIKKIG